MSLSPFTFCKPKKKQKTKNKKAIYKNNRTHYKDLGMRNQPQFLEIKGGGTTAAYVDELTRKQCHNLSDVQNIIAIGAKNRSVGITNINEHSSRSHSILSLEVMGNNIRTNDIYRGKIHLIDLAGVICYFFIFFYFFFAFPCVFIIENIYFFKKNTQKQKNNKCE